MNVYEVILSCERTYGLGRMVRELDGAHKVVAKNGDDAVRKAKEKISDFKPVLEGLRVLVDNVT